MSAHEDRIPSSKEPLLGPFLVRVRCDYRARPEARSSVRAKDLESIPGWSWYSLADQQWLHCADAAARWYATSGLDTDPSERESSLGRWISRQRKRRRLGTLPDWQAEVLDQMPGWTWIAKRAGIPRRSFVERELGWLLTQGVMPERARHGGVTGSSGRRWECDIVFDASRVVVEFDGHWWHRSPEKAAVDRRKTFDLEAAGWLVVRIREQPLPLLTPSDVSYISSEPITQLADRVAVRLLELGVPTGERCVTSRHHHERQASYYDDWYDKYDRFVAFLASGGSPNPSSSVTIGEFRLGQWVGTQRRTYQDGRLSDRKQELLSAIPGWQWKVSEHVRLGWDVAYQRLALYLKEHGRVPTASVIDDTGFRLGMWTAKQRSFWLQGALSAARVERLSALAGWSWEADPSRSLAALTSDRTRWTAKYEQYLDFVISLGHHPRANHDPERPLASWAAMQRVKRRKGTLDAEREAMLASLPDWSWGFSRHAA